MSRSVNAKRKAATTLKAIASFLLLTGSISIFSGCLDLDNEQPAIDMSQMKAATPKSQPIVTVDAFTAPESPTISLEKAKLYVKASAGLVELGVRWSERIDNAGDSEKIQILNAYNIARDQLCARVGLAGIAEFEWLTNVALPHPSNKPTFESVGLKTPN